MSGFLKTNQHNIERVFRVVAGAGRQVWATRTLSRREAVRRIGL